MGRELGELRVQVGDELANSIESKIGGHREKENSHTPGPVRPRREHHASARKPGGRRVMGYTHTPGPVRPSGKRTGRADQPKEESVRETPGAGRAYQGIP